MKRVIICTILLWRSFICCAQEAPKIYREPVDFSKLINYFEETSRHVLSPRPDSVKLPLLHAEKEYTIGLSGNPISFNTRTVVLENPFGNKFPVSFSVIYQDRLVSLFEPGVFVCHSIPSMSRDIAFEEKINTKRFNYHWFINDELIGISDNEYYFYDPVNGWSKYDLPLPIKDQPVLFDDDFYLCFRDCYGEWGGTVYFFDKATHKIYYTEATCANSVLKSDGNYFVLSHLGHMMGSARLKEIPNPAKLSVVDPEDINKTVDGQALGYTDKSNASQPVFKYLGIQIFSSFIYNNKTVYMVNWRKATFLAEIDNNRISIINPLFNNDLYTHDPITRSYGNTVFMNLDFYGIGRYQEISGIIIQGDTLIKYDWNQQHR